MPQYDEHADVLGHPEAAPVDASIASNVPGSIVSMPVQNGADAMSDAIGKQVDDADAHTDVRAGLPLNAVCFLNGVGLAAICAALAFAFAVQFGRGELPCPLCLLQRLAFVLAGMGLMLNLTVGDRPLHYAMTIGAAVGGCIPSLRQIALHLQPGDPGFGSALFGLHFYTWAFIGFVALILHCALCLALMRSTARWPAPVLVSSAAPDAARPFAMLRCRALRRSTRIEGQPRTPWRHRLVSGIGYGFLVLTIANALSTTLECGLGSCPDDPVQYRWWPHESLTDLS